MPSPMRRIGAPRFEPADSIVDVADGDHSDARRAAAAPKRPDAIAATARRRPRSAPRGGARASHLIFEKGSTGERKQRAKPP